MFANHRSSIPPPQIQRQLDVCCVEEPWPRDSAIANARGLHMHGLSLGLSFLTRAGSWSRGSLQLPISSHGMAVVKFSALCPNPNHRQWRPQASVCCQPDKRWLYPARIPSLSSRHHSWLLVHLLGSPIPGPVRTKACPGQRLCRDQEGITTRTHLFVPLHWKLLVH